MQEETYEKEIQCIKEQWQKTVSPFTDENGLMRVEGRIMEAGIERDEKVHLAGFWWLLVCEQPYFQMCHLP